MIELLLLFIAWVDSPDGWQQWQVFTVENKTEVQIACQAKDGDEFGGCTYDIPWRWIFIWEPLLYYGTVDYESKWGDCPTLWHELLHAQDMEYGRESWHGGSLRISEMPCQT